MRNDPKLSTTRYCWRRVHWGYLGPSLGQSGTKLLDDAPALPMAQFCPPDATKCTVGQQYGKSTLLGEKQLGLFFLPPCLKMTLFFQTLETELSESRSLKENIIFILVDSWDFFPSYSSKNQDVAF